MARIRRFAPHTSRLSFELLEPRHLLSTLNSVSENEDRAAVSTSAPHNELWPASWQSSEIEAKWTTTEKTLHELSALFPDDEVNKEINGSSYFVDIRWKGLPRRFTDLYYDTDDGALADESHVLRHRQRHEWNEAGTPPAFDDAIADLIDYAEWEPSWEKVQYKSTPYRIEAVWFRQEYGSTKLTSGGVVDTLDGNQVAEVSERDDPVRNAQREHPQLAWVGQQGSVGDQLKNTAFRYRVRLEDPGSGQHLFELSLDKVHSCTKNEAGDYAVCDDFFEVEVESLFATEANIQELFSLASWLEDNYPDLVPSTHSKGRVEVSYHGQNVTANEPKLLVDGFFDIASNRDENLDIPSGGDAVLATPEFLDPERSTISTKSVITSEAVAEGLHTAPVTLVGDPAAHFRVADDDDLSQAAAELQPSKSSDGDNEIGLRWNASFRNRAASADSVKGFETEYRVAGGTNSIAGRCLMALHFGPEFLPYRNAEASVDTTESGRLRADEKGVLAGFPQAGLQPFDVFPRRMPKSTQ